MHEIENIIILDKENPIAENIVQKDGKPQVALKTELDRYIYNSSQVLSALRSGINKARLSLSLLDFAHLECIESEGFSKAAYIEMLVENSIIRVQSVYDRVLILVNKVLDLGISNDQIGHSSIVTNEWVIRFELDNKIKAINKKCKDYRYIRNTVIHHDRYTEDELDKVTLFTETNELLKETGGKEFIAQEVLDAITSDYLDTKKEELSGYLDAIEQKIFELYDSLVKVYKYKKILLKKI